MKILVWIVAGWLGLVAISALGARLAPAHVMPHVTLVVIVFLALNREPVQAVFVSVVLGYFVGRLALAPVGIHEVAHGLCAVILYTVGGRLASGGPFFFAFAVAMTTLGYLINLMLLLLLGGQSIGFSSVATASLILEVSLTAIVGVVAYFPMMWLTSKLDDERHDGLQW